jgi:pimeloyl-ACP methyl ester carboxylesterase
MTPASRHVVFIHGLWLHASSWAPWTELFQTAGFTPLAPGWPGDSDTVEETRNHADQVAGKGIDDVVGHYAEIIGGLEAPPIVIGHSFGGLIVQRLATAADRRRQRPHGSGGDHQSDPEAVPQVSGHHRPAGVQRPGPLTDHRPRLA